MSDQILPRYLYIPMEIEWNTNLQSLDGKVYGVIYWYSKMSKKKCIASNRQIADAITGPNKTVKGVNLKSVSNSISRLAKAGYIEIVTADSHRVEIIPLLTDGNISPPSTDVGYGTDTDTPPLNDGGHNFDERIPLHPEIEGEHPILDTPPSMHGRPLHLQMTHPPSTDDQNNNINTEDSNNIYIRNPEIEKPKRKKSLKEPEPDFVTYLSNVPTEDVQVFITQFNVNETQVREKGEDMMYWWIGLSSKRKGEYSSPKAILRNAIKKDFGKRTDPANKPTKPKLRNITEERKAREKTGEPLFDSIGGNIYGSTI